MITVDLPPPIQSYMVAVVRTAEEMGIYHKAPIEKEKSTDSYIPQELAILPDKIRLYIKQQEEDLEGGEPNNKSEWQKNNQKKK